jgi:hypothetical protein
MEVNFMNINCTTLHIWFLNNNSYVCKSHFVLPIRTILEYIFYIRGFVHHNSKLMQSNKM